MPIDPSIVLNTGRGVTPSRSPAEIYSKILGVQNQQQDQELGRQQIESNRATMERNARAEEQKAAAAQRDADEDAAIQRSIIDNGGDLTKAWDGIYKTVRPAKALEFRKSLDESRKAAAAIAKDEVPVLEYQNGLKASVIQQALQLKPEEYAARWPEIAAAYNQLDPESGVDPTQPVEQGQLQFHLARIMAQTGILKERADREGLRQKTADANKAEADAKLTQAVTDATLKDPNLMSPEAKAKLDEQMLTTDIKEYNAVTPPEQRTREGLSKFLVEAANRKTPKTNVTTNVNARETFKDESQLREEFDKQPVVKAYNEIKQQAQRARGAYELAKQAEKDGKSASSSDQVIITVLNKVLDPESVVRESEYARTAEGQAALSRLSGWLDKMNRGGAGISSGERASIMETIESLSGATEREYKPVEERYRGLAGEYGFKPERVVPVASGGGSKKVTMVAPNGQTQEVDESQVKHYESLGAKRK